MRTTVTIPDDLMQRIRRFSAGRSLSTLTREALAEKLARLERERLAGEMEEGYRLEANEPSLDPEWAACETDGL